MEIMNNFVTWLKSHVLLSIMICAVILRLVWLDSNPPGMNWDEISMGYSAFSILKTGRDEWGQFLPLLFRSYGEWKSPVYIYILVPFIKVIGLNAWAVRLPAVLAGITSVYLTFLIGRKLYSEKVGLWASFLLTVSPWHLMLSRPAFEAGVALMLVLWGIYLALNNKYIWSALPLGLALHTYHSAKFVVPVVITYLAWNSMKQVPMKKLVLAAFILAVFAAPIALDLISGKSQKRYAQVGITTDAELVQRFYKYRETFPLGKTLNKFVFNKATFILSKGFSNWTSYLSPHFLLGSESIRAQHSIPFRGVMYLSEFALFCYGAMLLLRREKNVKRWLPFLVIGVGFIPPALTKDPYHVLRSILTLPWWQIVAAVGLVDFQKIYAKNPRIMTTFYFLLAAEIVSFLMIYFTWYPRAFARDWQVGYKEVAAWLAQNDGKYKHVYMTKAYGEPQIFLAFYNKWDPAWYQEENKKLLTYEEQGYPWLDQLPEYTIGKYTFRDMNWSRDNGKNESVFIGKPDDFWLDTPLIFQAKFPDGTVAFSVAEGH
jgi:4-amino-4-deoxy-L-arabinose transferase-like glycosyltransferase